MNQLMETPFIYYVQIDFPECVGFEEVKAQAKASGCIKNYKFSDKINFPLIKNIKTEFHRVILNTASVKKLNNKYITEAQFAEVAMFVSDKNCKKITKSIPMQGNSTTKKNLAEYPLAAAYVNEALYFARIYGRSSDYTYIDGSDGLDTNQPNTTCSFETKFDDFSNIPESGYQILDNKLYLYIRKEPFDGTNVGQELKITIDYEMKPVTLENLYWHNQDLEDYKPVSFKWDYFQDNDTSPYVVIVGNAGSFTYSECDFNPASSSSNRESTSNEQ